MGVEDSVHNDVLFGEDGWLFLWQGGHQQFRLLTGEVTPTAASVAAFSANIKAREQICAGRNLPYMHVVFPCKPLVMADRVPPEIRSDLKSLYERCYAGAVRDAGITSLIYPAKLLCEAKASYQVFSQHDTHMTGEGSAIVADQIIRHLGYDHDILSGLTLRVLPREGDLALMAGIATSRPEPTLLPDVQSHHKFDNKRALGVNTGNITIVHNAYSQSEKRLLALGDSFLQGTLDYLSLFFRDIMYVRSDVFQPDLLDSFAPDAVVTANLERYLSNVRPDHQAQAMVMYGYGLAGYAPDLNFSDALRAELAWKYYPSVYRKWATTLNALTFRTLGTARMNAQVRFSKGNMTFESLDRDPQLLFSATGLQPGRDYRLRVVMDSTVASKAQFYLGRAQPSERVFTEQASVSHPVAIGHNEMTFDIPAEGRSNQLRFDPLASPGQFTIRSIDIV